MSLAERLKDPMNACLPPFGEVRISLFKELCVGDLIRVGYENSGWFVVTRAADAVGRQDKYWLSLDLLNVSMGIIRDLMVNKEGNISGTWDVIRDGFLIRAKSYFP